MEVYQDCSLMEVVSCGTDAGAVRAYHSNMYMYVYVRVRTCMCVYVYVDVCKCMWCCAGSPLQSKMKMSQSSHSSMMNCWPPTCPGFLISTSPLRPLNVKSFTSSFLRAPNPELEVVTAATPSPLEALTAGGSSAAAARVAPFLASPLLPLLRPNEATR